MNIKNTNFEHLLNSSSQQFNKYLILRRARRIMASTIVRLQKLRRKNFLIKISFQSSYQRSNEFQTKLFRKLAQEATHLCFISFALNKQSDWSIASPN